MWLSADLLVTFFGLWVTIAKVIPRTTTADSTNFFKHKMVIFVFIFSSELVKRMVSNPSQLTFPTKVSQAYHLSLVGLLGFALFTDLTYMAETEQYMKQYNGSPTQKTVMISLLVTLSVIMVSLIIRIVD